MLARWGWPNSNRAIDILKSKSFDPFPFPDATPKQRATIADLAEELETTRRQALADVPSLTMTELYNLRELHRLGEATRTSRIASARRVQPLSIDSTSRSMRRSPKPTAGPPTCHRPRSSPASSRSTPSAPPRRRPDTSVGSAPTTKFLVSARRRPDFLLSYTPPPGA